MNPKKAQINILKMIPYISFQSVTVIPRARPRPSVIGVQVSVSVSWASVATNVTGVIEAQQENYPTVYLVGTALIIGTGL